MLKEIILLLAVAFHLSGHNRKGAKDLGTLYFIPNLSAVYVGDHFSVELALDSLVRNVKGGSVKIQFDATLLSVDSIWDGSLFYGNYFIEDTVIGDTLMVDFAFLDDSASGPGILFQIAFEAASSGSTPLHLFDVRFRDPLNQPIPLNLYDGLVRIDQYFVRGDANADGSLNVTDVVYVMDQLFPISNFYCLDAADANDDGNINVSDAVFILAHLFPSTGFPPPFPTCGRDPTLDDLGCGSFPPCETLGSKGH
ncbi:MAG: hypothetical protein J7K11_05390 [Candidatus Hydrothermae bacterium]|nr:hypothetical protein [Candidatus Hydrothermae bacterium]